MDLSPYEEAFVAYLHKNTNFRYPKNLYDPVLYILSIGGKKLRPILALIGTDVFGGNWKESLPLALSIEVFHNFTLLHDDVIDKAAIRRNKITVHKKWNVNTAILSGDAMIILAYTYLEHYRGKVYKRIMKMFNKTALEVCEGQQLDIDFETKASISKKEYLLMIQLKTAVLLGSALQLGAIVAGAAKKECKNIYNFGLHLGMAFQLQDDYLDTFGDEKSFGKKIGGDILARKKTYLYIEALEKSNAMDKQRLLSIYKNKSILPQEKIETVKDIFIRNKVHTTTQNEIALYTQRANKYLKDINIPSDKKAALERLASDLMRRNI